MKVQLTMPTSERRARRLYEQLQRGHDVEVDSDEVLSHLHLLLLVRPISGFEGFYRKDQERSVHYTVGEIAIADKHGLSVFHREKCSDPLPEDELIAWLRPRLEDWRKDRGGICAFGRDRMEQLEKLVEKLSPQNAKED